MLVQPFVKFRELTSQVFEFPKYSPVSVPRLIQFDPLNSANEWREIWKSRKCDVNEEVEKVINTNSKISNTRTDQLMLLAVSAQEARTLGV